MRDRVLLVTGIAVLAGIVWLLSAGGSLLPPAEVLAKHPSAPGWASLAHFTHNAFLVFRPDPSVTTFAPEALLAREASRLLWPALVFGIGFSSLIYFASGIGLARSLVSTSGSLALLLVVIGNDIAVWSALSWTPLAACAALRTTLARRDRIPWALIFVFCAVRVAQTSGALAPWACAGTLLVSTAFFFYAPLEVRRGQILLAATGTIICSAMLGYYRPLPAFPELPPGATLVPDDGLPGYIRPLVGYDHPIPVIVRSELRPVHGRLALVLLAGCLACVPFGARRSRKELAAAAREWAALYGGALTCAVFAAWDQLAPEWLAQLGPIAALARLWPQGSLWPGVTMLLPLGFTILAFSAGATGRFLHVALVTLIVSAVDWRNGRFVADAPSLFSKIQSDDIRGIEELIEDHARTARMQKLASPSLFLLRTTGTRWLAFDPAGVHFTMISKLDATLRASENTIELAAAHDRKSSTRWHAAHSGQTGTEWIAISLRTRTELSGVRLSVGDFHTDFPRGLEFWAHDGACDGLDDAALAEHRGMRRVYAQAHWLGPVKIASSGYPYFGSQSDVRVVFGTPVTARCLVARQTGRTSVYDWSVAEIGIGTVTADTEDPASP